MITDQLQRPGGDRCCRKHEMEGLIFGVIYSVCSIIPDRSLQLPFQRLKLEDKLAALQRDYERQTKGRRVPCLNYGHWRKCRTVYVCSVYMCNYLEAIEDRMADLVWNMGIYIECAEELECPRF